MSLPNVHAITLRETQDRTNRLASHLSAEGIECTMFPGINAPKWGIVTTNTFEVDNPGTGYIIGPKTVGIHMSHYLLWRHLYALIPHLQKHGESTEFTVLEDDVIFLPGWRDRYEKSRKYLPDDWDFYFLGSCDTGGKWRRQCGGEVYEIRYPFCLHAYMVRERGLKTMIETQERAGNPIDIGLAISSFPQMNVYTLLPRIADQDNCFITQ